MGENESIYLLGSIWPRRTLICSSSKEPARQLLGQVPGLQFRTISAVSENFFWGMSWLFRIKKEMIELLLGFLIFSAFLPFLPRLR